MKVNDSKEINNVRPSAPEARSSRSSVGDKVTVDGTREALKAVAAARQAAGAERLERLRTIEQQVRRGEFRPNPRAIAERILEAAELDAKLRSMLS